MECEICYGTKTIIIPAGQCGGEIVDEQEIECECVTYEKTDDIDVYVAQCPICKSVRIDTKNGHSRDGKEAWLFLKNFLKRPVQNV